MGTNLCDLQERTLLVVCDHANYYITFMEVENITRATTAGVLEDFDGSQHLYVSYRQRTNDPLLEYTPEASVDFGANWESGPTFLLHTSSEPAYTNSEPSEIIEFFEWRTYRVVDDGVIGQPLKFRLSVEIISP